MSKTEDPRDVYLVLCDFSLLLHRSDPRLFLVDLVRDLSDVVLHLPRDSVLVVDVQLTRSPRDVWGPDPRLDPTLGPPTVKVSPPTTWR